MRVVVAVLAAGAVAGCGGGNTVAPAASPKASFNCGVAETNYEVVAKDNTFDIGCFVVPAAQTWTITLHNRDGVDHNLAFYAPDASRPGHTIQVFHGDLFKGPATQTYSMPALSRGAYTFHCVVHHSMSGLLHVE